MVDDRKLNLPNGLPLAEEEVIPTGVQFQYSMVNAEFDFFGGCGRRIGIHCQERYMSIRVRSLYNTV